jgi:hypothetical protein
MENSLQLRIKMKTAKEVVLKLNHLQLMTGFIAEKNFIKNM